MGIFPRITELRALFFQMDGLSFRLNNKVYRFLDIIKLKKKNPHISAKKAVNKLVTDNTFIRKRTLNLLLC